MWPLIDRRKKRRRHSHKKIVKANNHRIKERRKDKNWKDLYIDNEPEIS
ncbi:MAG: hypothetical protein GY760_02305 [Deltaproteobacteria bacterium]|nr:hypothetical protein [Deltaproteobacteria bacterium]